MPGMANMVHVRSMLPFMLGHWKLHIICMCLYRDKTLAKWFTVKLFDCIEPRLYETMEHIKRLRCYTLGG